jgi:tRNA G46 methylase TrmB
MILRLSFKKINNRLAKLFKFIFFFLFPKLNSRIWSKLTRDEIENSYQYEQNSHDLFDKLIKDSLIGLNFSTLVEFGCHKGARLISLSKEYPNSSFFGIELNDLAVKIGTDHVQRNRI